MAQQIITLCDVCMADDSTGAGVPTTVSIDGVRPVVLDLCTEHRAQLLEPLTAALERHGRTATEQGTPPAAPTKGRPGRKPAQPADPAAAYVCVLCGHIVGTRPGLSYHLTSAHDVPTLDALYPETMCPACGIEVATIASLIRHAGDDHDSTVHGLYRDTIKAGDPRGLAARAREHYAATRSDVA